MNPIIPSPMTMLVGAVMVTTGTMASAATMSFQNSIDTTLIQNAADNNYGSRNEILIGGVGSGQQRAGLIEFDVTSMAGTYASIDSVTLRFVVARVAATNTWNLNLMKEANDGWVQGTANGTPQVGSPSWNYLSYDPTTPTEWAGGKSGARLGADVYGSMGSMTFTSGTTVVGTVVEVSLDPSLLATNVDSLTKVFDLWTAGSNAGLQIYGGGSAQWGVFSNEATSPTGVSPAGTLADRPQLIVGYTAIPEPSGTALIAIAGLGLAASRRRR